jgi:hypothetical protein
VELLAAVVPESCVNTYSSPVVVLDAGIVPLSCFIRNRFPLTADDAVVEPDNSSAKF